MRDVYGGQYFDVAPAPGQQSLGFASALQKPAGATTKYDIYMTKIMMVP